MRYVAFLRAVNVGTSIQSGNVFFDSTVRSKPKLTAQLEPLLAAEFGFDIPVMLRTLAELEKLVDSRPFGGKQAGDTQRLLVTFGPSKTGAT